MKQIGKGIVDFKVLATNYYYVDKTDFIVHVADDDITEKQNAYLFDWLKISNNKTLMA